MALVYNEGRTVWANMPLEGDIAELMGDRLKVYVEAEIKDTIFCVEHEVEEQEW